MAKLWGGRFSEPTDTTVEAFTASVDFDRRLYRQDIAGSVAHATMLAEVGVIDRGEREAIVSGLRGIESDIESGRFEWSSSLEDVHMNIEAALTERIGEAGKKLHTGRSRNDQVATDLRLYVRDETDAIVGALHRLRAVLLDLAEREAETVMPGFTHLQSAQPITFGHHVLAWHAMLERDTARFIDARRRINRLPLGAAALAGTSFPIDPRITARLLDFDGLCENSVDAVSDRDFVLEFTASAAILMVHLSRMCEELVLWCSPLFGFVRLPDAFCTGSSIMPQKKNPDVPELVRGKTGRVLGSLVGLLTLMKGQPLRTTGTTRRTRSRCSTLRTRCAGASRCSPRCSGASRRTGTRSGRRPAGVTRPRPIWPTTWCVAAWRSGMPTKRWGGRCAGPSRADASSRS